MPLRIVKDDEKKPGGFKSTQQKGNIVKGKLKSQKELKKITSSDEYKKADYQTKNKMLNVATHKRGALVGGQKKLDKNNNNRIDAQDFKILKAEKAKGRGMGLQDEKMKPGKVKPVKAVLGIATMGLLGAKMLKDKKKSAMAVPGVGASALIAKKKKEMLGKKKGGMFKGYSKVFETAAKAGQKNTGTSTIVGVKPKLPEASKKSKIARRALRAAKATRLGKIVLPIAAAGVAAQQYLKSKMKKKKELKGDVEGSIAPYKTKKKMGGGMMQKYAEGGPAEQSELARRQRRMGQRKKKPGALGGAGRPAAKKKRVMPIISSSETHSRQKDGSMKMTSYRYSADDGKAQTHTVRRGKVVKYDNAPFKTIDSRTYGLRVGGSVTVKTKLGRNKPTKMY